MRFNTTATAATLALTACSGPTPAPMTAASATGGSSSAPPATGGDANAAAEAVRSTIMAVFSGVDAHRWDDVRSAMTSEIQVNYSDLGGAAGVVPSAELVDGWAGFLPRFDRTVHKLHDLAIHTVGDRATATFTGIAMHTLEVDDDVHTWTVLAGYDTEFVREAGRWKMARIDLSLRGQAGNLELPALVQSAPIKEPSASVPSPEVERFFAALEANDRAALRATFAPTVVQAMPFAPDGFPEEVRGIDELSALFDNVIDQRQSYRRVYHATGNPRFVVASFDGEVQLEEGPYRNSYVNLFVLDSEGQIERIEEHFDPTTLLRDWPGLRRHHSVHPAGASTDAVTARRVTFESGGDTLVGRMFVPTDFDPNRPSPAVLVAGSWTSVKEQMPDVYASQFAARGLVALTFDFAGFGESEGMPRQLEAPQKKIRDIRAAFAFLRAQPGVDAEAIAGLGVCAGAGYMAHAVAEESRFARLLLIAPWLHNEELARGIYDSRPGGSTALIEASQTAERRYAETGQMEYVLAASELDPLSAMYVPNNAFDYYLNPTKGAGAHYDNRFAVASWEPWITFDGIAAAADIEQPVHIVHSQQGAIPPGTERFYAELRGEKSIEWLNDYTQADLYFEPAAVAAATNVVVGLVR
ncbi:MAG: nuclear transport factor 2 family protein [Myxococcota bacterium]